MLEEFKEYYTRAKMNQERLYTGGEWTEEDINDDLIYHVPIYDVVNRRFAAFSSFLEALKYGADDPKGNGKYFEGDHISEIDFAYLCYLFRLVGSGINYKPKVAGADPIGSHGFGNFWVVDAIQQGRFTREQWLADMPREKFADSKGYMLPLIKGGLRPYVQKFSHNFFKAIWGKLMLSQHEGHKMEIYEVVNYGNQLLKSEGYQRQNFVLCAFAMDLAEYFPHLVDRNSKVLVGTNAKKCLKLIFPDRKGMGTNLEVTNRALDELCNITGGASQKYDMEDVACDFIRYINNFQSPDHIKANGGKTYKNNLDEHVRITSHENVGQADDSGEGDN